MPSLFARQRRASESMPNDIPPPGLQSKRKSMDAGRPPVSGNKFKSLFSHGKEEEKTVNGRRSSLSQIFGDEEGSGSLRKRLSNASQIFHKSNEPQQQLTPTTPRVNGERSPSLGTFASPNLFPENFALSSTTSPETAGRRGSASWQPSYPTVLAEDAYPDLAPDGHPATQQLASSPKLPSENQFRRSLHAIPTPSPDEQPVRPFTPPKGPAPLPTPPPSATSPCRTLPRETDFPVDAQGAQSQTPDPFTAPEVHEVSKAELGLTESPKDESQSATSTAAPTKPSQRPILSLVTNNETAEPSSVTPVDQSPIDTPSSARRNPRPIGMPPRRTTLIQSPPMPQPIKNLPSMVGWPAFMRDGVPGTPGWGASGSKTPGWSGGNAPKTPGWSSLVTSPTSARPPSTPGGTGFPFSLPQTSIGQNKGKGRESMTEEDLRKARRAMPVMLREPSFKPPENDGGEVGASDEEDEESETEVEGHDDDSEPETEVEKAKKPAVPLRNRLRGNTKSKPVSALAHSAVQEEEATTPPARPEPTRNSTQKKSFWSLATPVKQPASWTSFSSSPSATPIADNRPESSAASENAEGYFSSNPSRSTLGTPRTLEPVLTKSGPVQQDAGLNRLIAAQAQADSSARADSPGSDGDASDGGSDESEGTSNDHNHVSAAPAAQINTIPESRPDAPKRPSFYTRQSRSMVNLAAEEREAPSTGTQLTTIKSREPAPGKIEMPTRSGPLAMMTPGWAKPPPTPAAGRAGFFWQKSKDGQEIGTLKRRRSADDMTATPPMYEPPFPGTYIPRPRDEEGKEKLPKYWCAVHIEGNMSRKMEFSSPGVQSRDRSWKKQYFIIHGTSLSVYRFDPHRFPLKAEPAQPIPSVTEDDSEEYLHVHCPGERRQSVTIASPQSGRRGSLPDTSAPRRTSVSSQTGSSRRTSISSVPSPLSTSTTISEKDPALFPNTGRRSSTSSTGSNHVGSSSIASHFQQNQLVKQYTLQNAESGLAADYVKRKNVVRVRAEGEQFLLQTDSARDVVDWIEAFQAATNVSLDLDERPMPKIITLPRRRRRRVPGTAGASGAATPANGDANPRTSDTPEGNAAAVASATRASRDRERMLAEDQASGTAAG